MAIDPLKDSPLLNEDPPLTATSTPPENDLQGAIDKDTTSNFERFWEQIAHAGLVEPALRAGTFLLSLILVIAIVWAIRSFNLQAALGTIPENAGGVLVGPALTPTPVSYMSSLPPMSAPQEVQIAGVRRITGLHTTIPSRPRVEVIQYTVVKGDSVFGIADQFGLKPETILWANTGTLQDNPHRLQVDQELNIMPVDGTYHKWSQGENLSKVAEFYGVDAMAILEWPGNHFDIFERDLENVHIEPGTMLIVPGGERELIDYGPPRIPRDNPAIARTYGPGHCGTVSEGIVGDGLFIWPTTEHWLSGYDYNPAANHPAIDIAGDTGNPVWAVDDGVIVYAGWSYSGYGNLIVIDHGNGWQSLYAHLNDYFIGCGESVFQGATIGTLGNTGNSSGDHLHFELMYITEKVNPWNFLP